MLVNLLLILALRAPASTLPCEADLLLPPDMGGVAIEIRPKD